MNAGGINKDNLRPWKRSDPKYPVSCSLRLVRDYRDLLPQDCVQEGGFPDIGPAYYGDKP